jgi:beta-phosphoglucomutase-like phosphatase (HAD superfamily)
VTPPVEDEPGRGPGVILRGRWFSAVIFDLDGVITDTAAVHRRAWATVFDEFLARHHPEQPEFGEQDYLTYVDGKNRADGVRSFLDSRSITLPETTAEDEPAAGSVAALAERKDRLFHEVLDAEGPHPIAPTVDLIRRLRSAGVPVAVVSASRNAATVLSRAGVAVDVRVDGIDADRLGLPGPDGCGSIRPMRLWSRTPNPVSQPRRVVGSARSWGSRPRGAPRLSSEAAQTWWYRTSPR